MFYLDEKLSLSVRKRAAPLLSVLGVRDAMDYEPHKLPWNQLMGHSNEIMRSARSLLDSLKPGIPDDEAESIDQAHNGLMALYDMIEVEKSARSSLGDRAPRLDGGDPRRPLGQNMDGQPPAASDLMRAREGLATFARSGDFSALGSMAEQRSMSAAIDSSGGYFVVPSLSQDITQRIFDQNPVRSLARTITITSGDTWEEPMDMGQPEAVWIGESDLRLATDTPLVEKLVVPLNEIYASQPLTQKLLDVSYRDLGAWLEGKLSDKFARTEGLAFVSGNGVGKPRGFLSMPTDTAADIIRDDKKLQYVATGSSGAISADDVRNLYWAMRAAHRKNSTWMMASATANSLDKLKDGEGQYIWRTGMTAGAPSTLLGLPVEFCEDMPAAASGNYPLALGDWKQGYIVLDMTGIRLLRDPFISKPNVLFYAYKRVGGNVANTDAIKLLQIS